MFCVLQGCASSDFNLISDFLALLKTPFSDLKSTPFQEFQITSDFFFSQTLSHPWFWFTYNPLPSSSFLLSVFVSSGFFSSGFFSSAGLGVVWAAAGGALLAEGEAVAASLGLGSSFFSSFFSSVCSLCRDERGNI